MKYFLKPKRSSLLDFLYDRKYGTNERVLFFDSERDIISFFRLALEEDIVNSSQRMNNNNSYWGESGMTTFQTVMEFSSQKIGFRDLLRNKFAYFAKTYFSHDPQKEGSREWWRGLYHVSYIKCNPRNYKLFTIQEKEVRGHKLNVVENLTWYRFYKKCLAAGIGKEEMVFSKN